MTNSLTHVESTGIFHSTVMKWQWQYKYCNFYSIKYWKVVPSLILWIIEDDWNNKVTNKTEVYSIQDREFTFNNNFCILLNPLTHCMFVNNGKFLHFLTAISNSWQSLTFVNFLDFTRFYSNLLNITRFYSIQLDSYRFLSILVVKTYVVWISILPLRKKAWLSANRKN